MLTKEQNSYTWGKGDPKTNIGKILKIKPNFFTSPYDHNIYRYIVTFDDNTLYQLGARDFLEYLAHKIQKQFWATNAPDIPYRTVDKIFEFYKLDFVPEAVRLLVVEYCLYNDNPVHQLINMFINQKLIENNREKFCTYDGCANFLIGISWQSKGGFDESIFTKTERRLHDFKSRLTLLYPHRQFNSIKQWIDNVSSYCKDNLSNKFIISRLYNLTYSEFQEFIDIMMNVIGIPVVEFSNHTVIHPLPPQYNQEQFIEFYIIKCFMAWIQSEKRGCPILEICQKNYGLYQKICNEDPINYSGICKYKLFLQSYGLEKLKIDCI